MTKLLCTAAVILASCFSANAQQTTQSPTAIWTNVEILSVGTPIQVKTSTKSMRCKFKGATDDALTCVSMDGAATQVFPRTDVKSVKVPRRGRSTLLGMAIGAGGGAVFGTAVGRNGSFVSRGAGAIIFAVPGALIGAIVGAATDFAHATVYKVK